MPAPFGWRCLTSPGMPRTPAPSHRTVRAVLPHTALRSPSATGMHGPPARSAQRPSHHRVYPESAKEGSQPRGNPLVGTPVSGGVKVRPLPSAEVMLSSACQRYYGPLRLPGQPGGDFGIRLIRPGWTPVVHWPGSPVVPPGAVPACHPCYPGGPRVTRQRYWAPEHRSSSPDNGVDALAELTGLHLGSLHAAACGVARSPRRALVRELGASGYPGVPVERVPSLKLPGRAAVRLSSRRSPLPGPDFHRRVPWYPRHTVRYRFWDRLPCRSLWRLRHPAPLQR